MDQLRFLIPFQTSIHVLQPIVLSMDAADRDKCLPLISFWEQHEQWYPLLAEHGLATKDSLGGVKINPLFSFLMRKRVHPDLHREAKVAFLHYYQHYSDWLYYLLKEEERPGREVKLLLELEESNLAFVIEELIKEGGSLERPFHTLDLLLVNQNRSPERIWWQKKLLHHFERIPEEELTDQQVIEYLALLENRALLCREQGLYEEAETFFLKAFAIIDGMTHDFQVFPQREANSQLLISSKAIALRNYATILREQKRWSESSKTLADALEIAQQLQDFSLQSDIWHDWANLEKARGRFPDSRKCFARALWLGRNDATKLAHLYFNLGALSSNLSQFRKSRQYYQKALDFFAENGNRVYESQCWQNLALILAELGEIEAARATFHRAISLFIAIGDEFKAAQGFQNLAVFEADQNQFLESIYYVRKAAEVYERLGLVLLRAEVCQNLGEFYRRMGDYDESIRQGEKAISLYQIGEEERQVGAVYQNLANTFMSQGDFEKAGHYYDLAFGVYDVYQETKQKGIIFQNRAELARRMGDYQEAANYAEKALDIYFEFKEDLQQIGWLVAGANILAYQFGNKEVLERLDTKLRQGLTIENYDRMVAIARQYYAAMSGR